jgi:hydroxyacylglutathione hydrolase
MFEVIFSHHKTTGLLLKQNSERFLTGLDLAEEVQHGVLLLDIRQPQQFVNGHLAGSLNIAFHPAGYAERLDIFVRPGRPLALVCEPGPERLAATFSLLQAGYNIIGYTEITAALPLEVTPQLSPRQLWQEISKGRLEQNLTVLDVRIPVEWNDYHIEGALHLPYFEIPHRLHELDPRKELVVIASNRFHSLTALSFLTQHGFEQPCEVPSGMSGWARSGLPIKRGSP